DSAAAVFRRARTSRAPRNRAIAARNLAALALRKGRLSEDVSHLGEGHNEDLARGAPISPIGDSVTVSLIDAWFETQPARAVQRLDALIARVPLRSLPVGDRDYFRLASELAIRRT